MGWLWRTSSTTSPTSGQSSENVASPDLTTYQTRNTTQSQSASSIPNLPEPIKQELSREEQANQDLNNLLKELESEFTIDRQNRIQKREDDQSSNSPNEVPIPKDISPDTLYQTEMSCRSALDYAMFCQSFGGQFVNVYRYGSFRSCSNHWSDFWLCMRTRNWDEKDRKLAIQDHYKQKAIKWKTGPSSEDIWNVREEPVKDAFQDNLEELEARIEEWKKANPGVADPWEPSRGTTFKGTGSAAAQR